ncbi:adenylate/guanylate cyclase domain-containing protein [Reinekea sp.]|jgi:class 3 adenylate cyclase|uniref:adenylate/guanylate cyclase domain-containing protein n=1 Tax=Reinekea sp. TaxID=1970455 RepID=UPI002A82EB3A|nr:adenylate/guanylate cyclase domain-containing protein [Reinekea sp.]
MTRSNDMHDEISTLEQGEIKAYIEKHHTAMLTVMFTDIENYTDLTERKGDAYVAQLRQHHDQLLQSIIEQDGSGMVVKFIGDAVMAVFSEPSMSVKRAVAIQQGVDAFNRDHPEFEDIAVRIGLHVGQIAVEDQVQMDIFGRHVNRAARVESLAAGGQILATYPVWDSAKGWIAASDEIQFKAHGAYRLKGIPDPVDIYEVYLPSRGQPVAPKKGRVSRYSRRLKWLNLTIVALLLVFVGAQYLTQQELALKADISAPLYVGDQLIEWGEPDAEGYREVINELPLGDYWLSYQVSSQLAYGAPLAFERKRSRLIPAFEEYTLPSLKFRQPMDSPKGVAERAFSFDFRADESVTGKWRLTVSSATRDNGEVQYSIDWLVEISAPNAQSFEGQTQMSHQPGDSMERFAPVPVGAYGALQLSLDGFVAKDLIDLALKWQYPG